jgi:valyl-tRNA synthetase
MFPKKYDHAEIESKIQKLYEKYKLAHPETVVQMQSDLGASFPCSSQESYVCSYPPPNVTWVLHLGHALTTTMEDVIIRYHRMTGKSTLWLPGTDHAGIATQTKVESKIKADEGKTRFDYGRVDFLDKVWDFALNNRSTIISQMKSMWSSLDWSRESFTLSEKLSRAVRKSFVELYNQGKIYQWHRVTNWDPVSQSVISDIEVIMKEQDSKLYYIKYFVTGGQNSITVATTRPDTVIADVAIAVNPWDKRFKWLVGKFVLAPITNRKIPVIADDYVDPAFGTGALKITPTHDANDFEIAQRHNLPMDIYAFDKEGRYTQHADEFAGVHIDDGFDNIVNLIQERWNLERIEDYANKIPTSERTGAVIQPIITKQWFYNTAEAAAASDKALTDGKLKIYPSRFEHDFHQWMDKIQPWCISRQLWWWHRIPVRYGADWQISVVDEDVVLAACGDKTNLLTLIVFNLIADSRLLEQFTLDEFIELMLSDSIVPTEGKIYQVYHTIYSVKFADNQMMLDQLNTLTRLFSILDSQLSTEWIHQLWELLTSATHIIDGGQTFGLNIAAIVWFDNPIQDPDVLDTWFSSWLRPMTTLWWPEQTPDYQRYFPQIMLETGSDIIFFWVARMTMMSYDLTGKMPFRDIILHGMVLDEKGKKQSKSVWNVVDPIDIIKDYGADTMRMALITGSTPGNPLKIGMAKFDQYSRFINKLWNASRYVVTKIVWEEAKTEFTYEIVRQQLIDGLSQTNDFDRWILTWLDEIIIKQHELFESYQLGEFSNQLMMFVRSSFCDWYIETSKQISSPMTDTVMIYVISTLCKLLHPYIPHVTEELRRQVGMTQWLAIQPVAQSLGAIDNNVHTQTLMSLISECRNLRNQAAVPNHEKVTIVVTVNHDFAQLIQQYETLVCGLIRADWIIYQPTMEWGELDPVLSAMLYDMKVGIKTQAPQLNWKDHLVRLQAELADEERFIADLRRSLSNPEFVERAPAHIIETKRQKLIDLTTKIEQMQIEIETIKMKNK